MFGIYYFESCRTSQSFVEPSKGPRTSLRKETKLLSVVTLYLYFTLLLTKGNREQKNLEKNKLKKVPFSKRPNSKYNWNSRAYTGVGTRGAVPPLDLWMGTQSYHTFQILYWRGKNITKITCCSEVWGKSPPPQKKIYYCSAVTCKVIELYVCVPLKCTCAKPNAKCQMFWVYSSNIAPLLCFEVVKNNKKENYNNYNNRQLRKM